MAIFSYTTGSDSHRISLYANETISDYSSVLLSDLAFIGDPELKISSYSEELEEQRAYSYDDSAVVGLDSTDYGFISEAHVLDDDFGLVTDTTNYAYQRIDYGFLTPDTTIKPFGSIGNITEFADVTLVRNSVGGVVFLMYGSAKIFVLPLVIGRGSFLARGDAAVAFSPQVAGTGSLFSFVSTTTVKASKQDGAGLFKLTSTSTNSFTPAPHIGAGSLFGFSSTTESYGPNPPETPALFRISGGITNERTTDSYVGTGYLNTLISHTEIVAYDYNESSVVIVDFDDYGFISESPVAEEDYLTITDTALNRPWNFANYGFITDNETRLPFGLFNVESATEIVFAPSNVTTGSIRISGDGKIYVLPIHLGSGVFKVQGSSAPAASLLHPGSGKFKLISGTAEATGPNPPDSTILFNIDGSAGQVQSPAIFGNGSFKTISGTADAFSSNPPETPALFRISGAATNEQRAFGYNGTGKLFPISGMAERVAYAYNESSVVLLDFDDYGFISESPVSERDDGLVTDINIAPGIAEDYGFLTPNASNLPFGPFNIDGSAGQIFTPSHVGSGTLDINGNAKIYILPLVIGRGKIQISGDAAPAQSPSIVGTGSLFGFTGSAEATTSQIPTETALFRISGRATESTTPATHIGSGSLFTFISATDSVGSNPPESTALFRISGAASNEQRAYGYFGTGTLFGIGGKVERVAYAYNESSVVAPDCLDYGFITAEPDDIPDPEVDYGPITDLDIRLPWQKADYGYITDFETRLPFGQLQIEGAAQTPASLTVIAGGRATFAGEASVYVTPIHIGGGKVSINGSVVPKFQIRTSGSGRMFGFGAGAEVVGSNPPESTELFKITGEATNIQATLAHFGSGSINLGQSSPGLTGDGSRGVTIFRLKHFGSGSIFKNGIGGEATVKKPTRGIELFRIIGNVTYQRNFNYNITEASFGSIRITGAATNVEFSRYQIGSGGPIISGAAVPIFRLKHFGSGQFSAITGAAEATGSNPPERIALFRIGGASTSSETARVPATTVEAKLFGSAIEKNTESYVGSGSLFAIGGSSQIFKVSADTSGLFKISGSAAQSHTNIHIGSGSLFTFVSKTESVGANPAVFGKIKITGSATEKNTEAYTGTGSLFTFVSATQSETNTESAKGLFRISGVATEKNTEACTGTGSLFTFVSKTEAVSNAESAKGLFRITGAVRVYRTFPTYEGSGRIFGFSGSAEATGANPPVSGLFKVTGSAIEKNTEAYQGTGSLFTFVSKTEASVVNPPEDTALFRVSGSADVSRGFPTYVGSGSLFTFVSKTEAFAAAPKAATIFTFTGSATEKNTEAYQGSGTFGTGYGLITGGALSFLYTYDLTKVLFKLSSGATESFTPTNYNGYALIDINGSVVNDKYVVYVPPRPTRIYVI